MDYTVYLVLLATLSGSLAQTDDSVTDMHFAGGSMMFRFVDTSGPTYKVEITALTGWVLGKGPCGPSCSTSDIGKSTTDTRRKILNVKGEIYFGNWSQETGCVHTDSKQFSIITTDIIKKLDGQVAAVNIPMKWEQEIAKVVVDIDPSRDYTDIGLHGSYWRMISYIYGVTSYPADYRLQIKVQPAHRQDTGRPNSSPLTLFKPVYKILLNQATTMRITTLDPDGDVVKCSYAEFIEAGGLGGLKNTTVNENCSIVIDAQESAGFVDGGWGAIPVKVYDVSHEIKGDMPTLLSSISVQFMIQTVQTIDDPEFVDPTMDTQHEFTVYVGSSVKIPLFAKPAQSSNNEIGSFYVRSMPPKTFNVSKPIPDDTRSSERVKYTIFKWTPGTSDIGEYVLGVLVTDTNGQDGQDRNYNVYVKDIELMKTTEPLDNGPYFPLIPNTMGVSCWLHSTCSFPIYIGTKPDSASITSVKYATSTFQSTNIEPPQPTTINGTAMFVSEVAVLASEGSQQRICLEATDSNGQKGQACLLVNVTIPDPCTSSPCGENGVCTSHGESYTCVCGSKYTGRLCENEIDFCARRPCLNNGLCQHSSYYAYECNCKGTGYVGVNCEKDEVDCTLDACGSYGVCRDLNGKYECDCFNGYSGDICNIVDSKCSTVTCQNGGICLVEGGVGVCKCPLGYSGLHCTDAHVPLQVNNVTRENPFTIPSLQSGTELQCFVGISGTCKIALYLQKPATGSQNISVGLHSPDVTASLSSPSPDPFTGSMKTILTMKPSKLGMGRVCVNSGSKPPDTLCYNVNATMAPDGLADRKMIPTFYPPTPFRNSIINCIHDIPCHVIITTNIDPLTRGCSLYSGSTSAIVFNSLKTGSRCETDVLFNPPGKGYHEVCLQAGPMRAFGVSVFQGERRCFTLRSTTSDTCSPNPCNNGSCILQPGESPAYKCICPANYTGDRCQYEYPCVATSCKNGGFCEAIGKDYECRCRVGFKGHDCDQITPTGQHLESTLGNGATIECEVGTKCTIPVWISGQSVQLLEGPKDTGILATIWRRAGKLGANRNEDLLEVTPLTPGDKRVCVTIQQTTPLSGQSVCYHIKTSRGNISMKNDGFVSPTLPAATVIPCAAGTNCHVLMYSRFDGNKCQQVEVEGANIYLHIFPSKLEGGSCVTDVYYSIGLATGLHDLCFKLGMLPQRCYKVNPINTDPCKNQDCGGGACIVKGYSFECVCDAQHRGAACNVDVDFIPVG